MTNTQTPTLTTAECHAIAMGLSAEIRYLTDQVTRHAATDDDEARAFRLECLDAAHSAHLKVMGYAYIDREPRP